MSNVFALNRHHKVIGTDGRISGQWVVLLGDGGRTTWITPHEVTLYDEDLRSGIVLHSDDLTAGVEDGVARIGWITGRRQDDVKAVRGELEPLLVEIARVAATENEGDRCAGITD